jgi:invasion protein IalB
MIKDMKRRRFYIFMAVFVVSLLSHMNAIAGSNRLLLQDVTMQDGGSALLSLQLENEDPITGFQCDLYLPTGVSIDNYMTLLGRTNTNQHGVTTRKMEDGAIRILCASTTNAVFSGNSGEVLSIRVSNTLSSGQYEMSLKNIILTDPDATRYVSQDVTGSITILGSNKLELQDLSILDGNSNQTLSLCLKNSTQISDFQCDLYLPEGVEVLKNEDGSYQIDLKRTNTNDHGVFVRRMEDGCLRIVCTSMNGKVFSGNDGEVLGIQIKCNLESGSHLVRLKKIILTNSDAARFTSPDVTCNINVIEPVVITAKSYTRLYGDANPAFEYTAEGATLDGVPEIICEATATSPIGEYPIIIKKGNVKNSNDTYVNGVLTITKAPLTITANNCSKKQYDPMPEFSVSYDGFKNEETAAVLTKPVIISCDANADSAPGNYDITVSGAEAKNYEIQYVAGKLTVTEPDSYTLRYVVDGKEYQTFSIKYRDVITPLVAPTKEGYTFSGWSEIPETMPAKDVTVTGTFMVNSYTLLYMVDGEEYKRATVEYESELTAEVAPEKEGYTFSGWSEIPEKMPAHDLTVNGSFTVNKYIIRYYVGEQLIAEDEVEYGDEVVLRDYTPVDAARYTFIGWEGEKYETMPAHDIEYHANIADGINGLAIGNLRGVQAIYDANGRKLSKIQSGGNILLMRDGTKRKVVVK